MDQKGFLCVCVCGFWGGAVVVVNGELGDAWVV